MVRKITAKSSIIMKLVKTDRWLQWVSQCHQRPVICAQSKKTCKNEAIQWSLGIRISDLSRTQKKIRLTIFIMKTKVRLLDISDLHLTQLPTAAHNGKSVARDIKSPSKARIPKKVRILIKIEKKRCPTPSMNFVTQNSNWWPKKRQTGLSWRNFWHKCHWSMIYSTVSRSRTKCCSKVRAKFSLRHLSNLTWPLMKLFWVKTSDDRSSKKQGPSPTKRCLRKSVHRLKNCFRGTTTSWGVNVKSFISLLRKRSVTHS